MAVNLYPSCCCGSSSPSSPSHYSKCSQRWVPICRESRLELWCSTIPIFLLESFLQLMTSLLTMFLLNWAGRFAVWMLQKSRDREPERELGFCWRNFSKRKQILGCWVASFPSLLVAVSLFLAVWSMDVCVMIPAAGRRRRRRRK